MTNSIPSYDALYSISDLHLGGPPGRRMFGQETRLGGFLGWLAKADVERCGLVLAGDVIDSLASLTAVGGYIMIECAADLVGSTLDAVPAVLEGLRLFVRAKGRELVVMLGNHDLELALAEAQQKFLELVADGDADARGRVRFYTNGTGFRCRVGDQAVYITHGNEADPWNHVDYEALRRVAHLRSLGHAFNAAEWSPNAGTKLVVDAMNDIKRRHPFVDLLKPETDAALKVLAVLDDRRVADFYAALPALAKAGWAHTGPHVVLGAPRAAAAPTPRAIDLLIASEARLGGAGNGGGCDDEALMERVLALHRKRKAPEDLVVYGTQTLSINIAQRVFDLFRGLTPTEAMRRALLDWTEKDRGFALDDVDDVCSGVLSQLGTGIDVVITGHTHLPRWIHPYECSCRVYLNAGTWARLIGLDRELLEDQAAFAEAYEAMLSNDFEKMDGCVVRLATGENRRLVLDATLAARVLADGSPPGLVRVRGDGTTVEPVDPKDDPRRWS